MGSILHVQPVCIWSKNPYSFTPFLKCSFKSLISLLLAIWNLYIQWYKNLASQLYHRVNGYFSAQLKSWWLHRTSMELSVDNTSLICNQINMKRGLMYTIINVYKYNFETFNLYILRMNFFPATFHSGQRTRLVTILRPAFINWSSESKFFGWWIIMEGGDTRVANLLDTGYTMKLTVWFVVTKFINLCGCQ